MSAVYSNMGDGANPVKPLRLLDRMRQAKGDKDRAVQNLMEVAETSAAAPS